MDQEKVAEVFTGLVKACLPSALYYLSEVDWDALGLPAGAALAIRAAVMGLRYETTQENQG